MSEPGSARRASVLILLATFALGVIAGVGAAPLLRPPPGPPGLGGLRLRPGQRERVEAIIARNGPAVEAALGDALPRLRAVQEQVAAEIEAELDDDQKATFRRERARRGPPLPR